MFDLFVYQLMLDTKNVITKLLSYLRVKGNTNKKEKKCYV